MRKVSTGTLLTGLFLYAAAILAFFTVVFPNSFHAVSFGLLLVTSGLALFSSEHNRISYTALVVWGASTLITTIYMIVGLLKGYHDATIQVFFIYIVSPALWLLVATRVLQSTQPIRLIRFLLVLGVLGVATIFLFYALYIHYGPSSLLWLFAQPNLNYESGTARATMHVFGSLMFIVGGFIASPQSLKGWLRQFAMLFLLLMAAFMSGRTALLLAFFVGIAVFLLGHISSSQTLPRRYALLSFMVLCVAAITTAQLSAHLDFNAAKIIRSSYEKIMTGGGTERLDQLGALLEGVKETSLLGAGHGVGVSVVRSPKFPWRYELLWLATLYRVGLVGAIIYALPIILIIWKYLRLLWSRSQTTADNFFFGAFLAAFLGSGTNPYYESFEFQWMLVLPFVYFVIYRRSPKIVPSLRSNLISREP